MKQALDAVYEGGTFRPVQPGIVAIPDGRRVRLTVEIDEEPDALQLAMGVYDGLSPEDIDDVERLALDRGKFFGARSAD